MGTLSEKLTRIKDAMTQIRSGFDLEDTVIESVASTTTELHASQTQTLAENAVTIQDLNTTLNARNNEINRLNTTVNTQETTIQSQAQTITTLNATVDEQVVQISTLENTIVTKDATINELNETVLSKDAEIANLNARIEELENPSASEPEYINLTVSMRTNDNSSLPDDFTYSIDVYDADNNAIYTNLSPDAISGEHNEVAFSDMPEDFIVGNTYTVIARSWSEGYVIISDNPYYFTVDHNNTEACFTLQTVVTTTEQPENTMGDGRISISMLDGGLDGSSRNPLSTDYTMNASIYTNDDVFVKSGSGTNPFDITGLADGEYYCVIDSVTDASGKITHEAQLEKYAVTVTNGYGSVYGSVNLLAE